MYTMYRTRQYNKSNLVKYKYSYKFLICKDKDVNFLLN